VNVGGAAAARTFFATLPPSRSCLKDFGYHADPPQVRRGLKIAGSKAAMVAPHFSACLIVQSDFGLPAGAVLATRSFRTFPQNSACGVECGKRAFGCHFASMLHLD